MANCQKFQRFKPKSLNFLSYAFSFPSFCFFSSVDVSRIAVFFQDILLRITVVRYKDESVALAQKNLGDEIKRHV